MSWQAISFLMSAISGLRSSESKPAIKDYLLEKCFSTDLNTLLMHFMVETVGWVSADQVLVSKIMMGLMLLSPVHFISSAVIITLALNAC